MRLFAKPPWAEEFRCKCGGKIMIQPWDTTAFIEDEHEHLETLNNIANASQEEIDAMTNKNRMDYGVLLHGAQAINYICCKCRKQWRDYKSDWIGVAHSKSLKLRLERHKEYDEGFHPNDEWEHYDKNDNLERESDEKEKFN